MKLSMYSAIPELPAGSILASLQGTKMPESLDLCNLTSLCQCTRTALAGEQKAGESQNCCHLYNTDASYFVCFVEVTQFTGQDWETLR